MLVKLSLSLVALKGGQYPQDSIGAVSSAVYSSDRDLDAAEVRVQGRQYTPGYIQNIGQITNIADPAESQAVGKMGAATGLTHGVIESTDLTWTQTSHLGTITLYDQIRVDNSTAGDFAHALPGDSGAALVTNISNKGYMVGTVIAGQPGQFTVCNRCSYLQQNYPKCFEK